MQKITLNIILCIGLVACSSPSQKFTKTAKYFNFYPQQIIGKPFQHQFFLNQQALNNSQKDTLHVYIDGDGTPWEGNRWVSRDPTSRNPMILDMMNADNAPSILLGRPCYHGPNDISCNSKYWTSHRYSEVVVNSMSNALNNWLLLNPYKNIVLIGFSGGGTLAVLMATNIHNISTLVTIAANLDVNGWSHHHNYKPLKGFLNPLELTPFPSSIKQIHFAGLQDKNVPAKIIKNFSDKQTNAIFYPVAKFNHHCCWATSWNKLLKIISSPLTQISVD